VLAVVQHHRRLPAGEEAAELVDGVHAVPGQRRVDESDGVADRLLTPPAEADPLVGPNDGDNVFTCWRAPIRRLADLPRFVVNRGGEYCFAPSLTGLRWLAHLDS
jgi:hypothetical protein